MLTLISRSGMTGFDKVRRRPSTKEKMLRNIKVSGVIK
jgi:hypothetical protein